jgi:5-methylcytosine-specific restriction endonuclease McrA
MARLTNIKPRLGTQPDRLTAVSADSWRAGKTTNQRGYDYKWQKARERFLFDNPLCVYCQREGRVTAASVVDHITPHHGDQALFWRQSNWQPLCKPCHDSVKQREEAGSR